MNKHHYKFNYLFIDFHFSLFGINSVLDPDGKFRTVKYTADKHNGFHARIFSDGHEYAFYPPPLPVPENPPATNPPATYDESDDEGENNEGDEDEEGTNDEEESEDEGDDEEDDEVSIENNTKTKNTMKLK